MSLRNVMRKAAGLLVEMPDEPEPSLPDVDLPEIGKGATDKDAAQRPAPDIDELLAVVRGPKSGALGAGSGASSSASSAPAPATATATQVAQSGTGPNLDQIKSAAAGAVNPSAFVPGAPAQASGPGIGPDGKVKLPVIYEAAGIAPTPFTAEQALELIAAMPADLPIEVRRQMVKATLSTIGKTLGATPQTIVADATRKATALESYLESYTRKSEEFTKKVEGDIATLEAQIAEKRKAIETARRRVSELSKFCDQEAERLDDVLEFFSLDVGPSKYAAVSQIGSPAGNPTGSSPGNAAGNQPINPTQNLKS